MVIKYLLLPWKVKPIRTIFKTFSLQQKNFLLFYHKITFRMYFIFSYSEASDFYPKGEGFVQIFNNEHFTWYVHFFYLFLSSKHVCLFVYQLSIYLSVFLSVCLSVCFSACSLSIYLTIYLSVCMYLYIYIYIY